MLSYKLFQTIWITIILNKLNAIDVYLSIAREVRLFSIIFHQLWYLLVFGKLFSGDVRVLKKK